ncbi:MAG: PHP domain-containing protein [Thermodesulfobacteriota bacterium]|nr:PHP domain-containing protein [Thermodesulfobacteriota bacterium]
MKIDLHIHSKDCSDGRKTLQEIFEEAKKRNIHLISITDHDSLDCQELAEALAKQYNIKYISGLELNVSFSHPEYKNGKPVSLDFLAYQYNIHDKPLRQKLKELREYREVRAQKILTKINEELISEKKVPLTEKDMETIRSTVDGAFGRPHIANYMITKGIVANKKEAFEKYLVKCDVPKMPFTLSEASRLVREAGGKLILAHPNDPGGTSLVSFTDSLDEQQRIIKETMLPYIDGIECWHSKHGQATSKSYLTFAQKEGLLSTGGSDCHQQPTIMGTVHVPQHVADQFHLYCK